MTAGPAASSAAAVSEEEARPDGFADGDHRHLAGAELMLQARFVVRRFDRLHDDVSEKERAQAPNGRTVGVWKLGATCGIRAPCSQKPYIPFLKRTTVG